MMRPYFYKRFYLRTDLSERGMGSMLLQNDINPTEVKAKTEE